MVDWTDQVDIAARVAWGEARAGGASAMADVLSVVRNRVEHPSWWGTSWLGVLMAKAQFSCLNAGDPNRAKLLAVTPADPQFAEALALAREAVAGRLVDQTGGADSYFATSIAAPDWTKRAVHTCTRWKHSFWRVQTGVPAVHPLTGPHVDPAAPTVGALSADALNAQELARVQAADLGGRSLEDVSAVS